MSTSSESSKSSSVALQWGNVYGLAASAAATAFVIVFVLRPVVLRPPKRFFPRIPKWVSFSLDFGSAPVIACVVLAAIRVLSGRGILQGLRGNEAIQPFTIIVIFFGLAYMSISFDVQGVFEALALLAVKTSGSSGRKLFFLFWLVTSVVTVVASNDVAILTITPIICHFTRKLGVDPKPFLLVSFFAANIWSMLLEIGNPTNIIVGVAYRMSFLGYTMWMGLPALLCGVAHFLVLFVVMRKRVPATISATAAGPIQPLAAIRSRTGAVFGCIALGSCILLLCVSYWIGVELWVLCGAFWGLYLARDLISDTFFLQCHQRQRQQQQQQAFPTEAIAATTPDEVELETIVIVDCSPSVASAENEKLKSASEECSEEGEDSSSSSNSAGPRWAVRFWERAQVRFPTVSMVAARMPWRILPFVLGMFVLVQCLKDVGWVNNAAWLIARSSSSSFVLAIFVSGFVTSLSALVLNNQPATILFTMVLQQTPFPTPRVAKAWALGLILGSNMCANLTIFGALAGIMWISIVRAHGVEIKAASFSKLGFATMPAIIAIGCGIVAAELAIFPTTQS